MVQYLRDHPYVYFPVIPNPHHWSTDYSGLSKNNGFSGHEEYLGLYAAANARHQIRGDASTTYLACSSAVPKILEFCPDAKFVVMLRNPVEIVISLHRQLMREGVEVEGDLESAWALQSERQRRQSIPPGCPAPGLLHYRKVASIGQQLKAAHERIPAKQLLTIFRDDFLASPRQFYRATIEFLDLPIDNRHQFPLMGSRAPRTPILYRLKRRTFVQKLYHDLLTSRPARLMSAVKEAVITRPPDDRPLRPVFRNKLVDTFSEDIRLLADLTGRELDGWLSHQKV